jgi:hypothetical protein
MLIRIDMKKQEQIDALRTRIERIEAHLAEQNNGANFSKLPEPTQPDPYMPDWTQARGTTVAHSFDADGTGWLHRVEMCDKYFTVHVYRSPFRLADGLDWEKSLRVNGRG